jgi:hypothetical protein
MNRPLRTTLLLALAGGVLSVPAALLAAPWLPWRLALMLLIWGLLALYCLLLARWGGKAPVAALLPLGLLLATLAWPPARGGFFCFAAGVLAWVRSGICFPGPTLRALAGEGLTILAGGGLVMALKGDTPLSWALGLALFTLVQGLYFFLLPGSGRRAGGLRPDPFERASRELRSLLASGDGATR